MQPAYLEEGRKVATKLGTDVIVFEYVLRTWMRVYGKRQAVSYRQWGIATTEDFQWYANSFEILHSAVVSPQREGE